MGRHRRDEPEDAFRLLLVCTGNICRSPFAEILGRHLLNERLGGRTAAMFDVSSAGVRAVVGSGMHPDSRAALAPWNLDGAHAEEFVARQLCSTMIERSHLVLGATPRHRSAVVERCPTALAVTFSLREFARLATAVDPEQLSTHPVGRAHALVDLVRLQRGLVAPDPDGDNIPDPVGAAPEAHRHVARLTDTALITRPAVVRPRTDRVAVLELVDAGFREPRPRCARQCGR